MTHLNEKRSKLSKSDERMNERMSFGEKKPALKHFFAVDNSKRSSSQKMNEDFRLKKMYFVPFFPGFIVPSRDISYCFFENKRVICIPRRWL